MGIGSSLTKGLAPRVTRLAPELTSTFVRKALHRAIHGVGPLRPPPPRPTSSCGAGRRRRTRDPRGDREPRRLRRRPGLPDQPRRPGHVAFTVPANITGLALIQCRMVAGIAHLRGYDLTDPRVRNAVLVCLLGEDAVTRWCAREAAGAADGDGDRAGPRPATSTGSIADEVASELVAKVAGKRLAATVGRRVPVVGGLVGAGADGLRHLADRPLRRPRAPAPRPPVGRHRRRPRAGWSPGGAPACCSAAVRRPQGPGRARPRRVEVAPQLLVDLRAAGRSSSSRASSASTAASATIASSGWSGSAYGWPAARRRRSSRSPTTS